MSLTELWELFPIVLVPYNPHWKEIAKEEIVTLAEILEGQLIAIHHIGSTAIPGIWAKPIIDIIVEVKSASELDFIKERLIQHGYICMATSPNRLCFNKGYTPKGFADKVVHIHLRLNGDTDEILFRDYLISHPEVAKEYEELKLSLWKSFEHYRDGYTQAKTAFVNHYTTLAKQELKN